MRKQKFLAVLIGSVILAISILTFISFNNNHKECITDTAISKNNKGEETKVETHICKEEYNF